MPESNHHKSCKLRLKTTLTNLGYWKCNFVTFQTCTTGCQCKLTISSVLYFWFLITQTEKVTEGRCWPGTVPGDCFTRIWLQKGFLGKLIEHTAYKTFPNTWANCKFQYLLISQTVVSCLFSLLNLKEGKTKEINKNLLKKNYSIVLWTKIVAQFCMGFWSLWHYLVILHNLYMEAGEDTQNCRLLINLLKIR